jgi:WbqC-like protein family
VIIAAHQPNILPNSRFWYKAATADIMDLRYRAQYTERGYQRRVKMRDNWLTLPLVGKPRTEPINQVLLDVPAFRKMFPGIMHGRYSGSRHYKTRGLALVDFAMTRESGYLWEFNLELLLYVRDLLGIETPFALGVDTIGDKAEGVLSLMRAYPQADTYLSGQGAKAYMGDTTIFDEAGIKVEWSRHKPITDDSIVTLLMDYDNPIELVMQEEGNLL